MNTTYGVKILADSISPGGVRLTTLQATYPRFIHAEMLRHRMFSHAVASSRAIPPDDRPRPDGTIKKGLITRVIEDPFVPETFNRRVPGMGVGEALINEDQKKARAAWLRSRDKAVEAAVALVDLDCDKSRINRLLEPYLWLDDIITATEWDNFFALRCHPAAQPEFQIIAGMIRDTISSGEPRLVSGTGPKVFDRWHLPFVEIGEPLDTQPGEVAEAVRELGDQGYEFWPTVSAGRVAKVSFDNHENYETPIDSVGRAQGLMGNGHFSPFESVARPLMNCEEPLDETEQIGDPYQCFVGNFRGWVQMRKLIPNEDRFDLAMAVA